MRRLRLAGYRVALVLLAVPALPVPGAAQVTRVAYDRVEARPLDGLDDLPAPLRDEVPRDDVAALALYVEGTASLLAPLDVDAPDDDASRRARIMAAQLRRLSPTRNDHETLRATWTDLESGAVVETREFLGRTFLIRGSRPEWNWKLTGEQRIYLDRLVLRATATVDSTRIDAWFTPEIPLPGGPGRIGGLPGLILLADVDDGRLTWTAREVTVDTTDEVTVEPPTEGDEIDRAAYEGIVAEKLAELRAARRRR